MKKLIAVVLTAAVSIHTILKFGLTIHGFWALAVTWVLCMISWIDWKTMVIPDFLNLTLFILAVLLPGTGTKQPELAYRCLGFLAVSVPMVLLNLAVAESFGGGDIKLAAVCGFMLGFRLILLSALLSVLTGGSYAIYLLVSGKGKRKSHFAFGPFLAFGIWMALCHGNELIHWYFNFF